MRDHFITIFCFTPRNPAKRLRILFAPSLVQGGAPFSSIRRRVPLSESDPDGEKGKFRIEALSSSLVSCRHWVVATNSGRGDALTRFLSGEGGKS
jgi:hypothetical protein